MSCMDWLDNLLSVVAKTNTGKCPHCGGNSIGYSYTIFDIKHNMGCCDIWCNSCLHGYHVSRMEIPDNIPREKMPKKIIFEN